MFSGVLELALDKLSTLVFIKDENSIILYANEAFLGLYAPERRAHIVGYTTMEDFTPEEVELWLAEDRKAMAQGQSTIREELVDYKGLKRTFLTRKIAFYDGEGAKRMLGFCEDITDLVNKERDLVEANELLRSFTVVAAHDLASPIAAAVSALEVIKLDHENKFSPSTDMLLQETTNMLRNSCGNISSLLLATKLTESKEETRRHLCDLNMMVEEIRFALSSQLERASASLLAVRLPTLNVEANLFRQVLQNLIENSIKYRSSGQKLWIHVKYQPLENGHEIAVEDNGIGITKEKAEKLFDLFAQGSHAAPGLGIALSLCKRIIDLHGGTIAFDTSFENGSRVVITLPKDAVK